MGEKSSAAGTAALAEPTLIRILDAPPSLVCKAWTDESHEAKGWAQTGHEPALPARPSFRGQIRIGMRCIPWGGEFREIVDRQSLVFATKSLEAKDGKPQLETLVTVTLAEDRGKTRLTLRLRVTKPTPEAPFARSGMDPAGHRASRLEALVASLKRIITCNMQVILANCLANLRARNRISRGASLGRTP